jgi:hypothetical protein
MRAHDKQIRVTRGEVKRLRRAQGWSAARLGVELGNGIAGAQYSRSYIKSIEGGSLPLSRFFVEKFLNLRARVIGEQVSAKQILMRGKFPKRLVIAAKPKRCDVCGWAFVASTPTQLRCGPVCAQVARVRAKAVNTEIRKTRKAENRKAVKEESRKCVKSRLQIKRAVWAKPQRRLISR